jgi:hypothetical protein
MKKLQVFYNQQVKAINEDFPAFEELNEEAKKVLKNSVSFSLWNFKNAVQVLKNKVKKIKLNHNI